jgi:hypothetical protein
LTFQLPKDQRDKLLAENYAPLVVVRKPFGCEPGARYVLKKQKQRRFCNEDGTVVTIPEEDLWWITVTKVQRRISGDWLVRFDVTDRRHPVRLVRRKPPATPTSPKESSKDPSEESGYTSDIRAAVDYPEAVDKEWLDRESAEISAHHDELRRRRAAGALKAQHRRRRGKAA